MASHESRSLPVVAWLQVGAAAAAMGFALASSPVAAADDGGAGTRTVASSDSARPTATRAEVSKAASPRLANTRGAQRPAAAVGLQQRHDTEPVATRAASSVAISPNRLSVNPLAVKDIPVAATANATAVATPSTGTGSVGGAKATAAAAADPTVVVTSIFHEMLRTEPTSAQLRNYERVLRFRGVKGVVSGIYNTTAFRQMEVNSYYLEMLGRTPTQTELRRGAFTLLWGREERLVASIAGTDEFYADSSAGGGVNGTQPSATTFVNLLYRSLLGQSADPDAAAIYIQQLQAGIKPRRVATQFVNSDAWRTVKVNEVYTVAELTGDPTAYVSKWFLNGGLRGITTKILSSTDSVAKLAAGVALPNLATGALLQDILLSSYSDFVASLKDKLGTEANPCGSAGTQCDEALYTMLSTGGTVRGIPNNAVNVTSIFAQVSDLIPTQNEVDMKQSLLYPLRDPSTTSLYLTGGPITAPGGIVLTANNGTYVIDGHHRWSALYVMNPYTSIAAIDLGYVPTPQDALKQTQMAIAAKEGYLPWKSAPGTNLFTVPKAAFYDEVNRYIWDDLTGDPTVPKALWTVKIDPTTQRPYVFDVFIDDFFDISLPDGPLSPVDQAKYTGMIQDYLWGNVERMRLYNTPIPDATPRDDMPQPVGNSYPPYLQLLETGKVLYDMPVISYLG